MGDALHDPLLDDLSKSTSVSSGTNRHTKEKDSDDSHVNGHGHGRAPMRDHNTPPCWPPRLPVILDQTADRVRSRGLSIVIFIQVFISFHCCR